MELVDVYNNKHEKQNYKKNRKELSQGEFRLSCFAWIINDKNEILIQQRLATAKTCPNMWETVSGGAMENESEIVAMLREIKEELGLNVEKKELIFIGSYARTNDYVEVFLLNKNVKIKDLKLQPEEVQNAKFVKISSFEKLIEDNLASDTGYSVFKQYYDKFYKRVLTFENGKPVYKKITCKNSKNIIE